MICPEKFRTRLDTIIIPPKNKKSHHTGENMKEADVIESILKDSEYHLDL